MAIDDCTRVAYAEVLPDEQGATTVGFLTRAHAWYAARGVRMTWADQTFVGNRYSKTQAVEERGWGPE